MIEVRTTSKKIFLWRRNVKSKTVRRQLELPVGDGGQPGTGGGRLVFGESSDVGWGGGRLLNRWTARVQSNGLVGAGMHSSEKKRGHYLGTEIDEKWWRRYARDGLLARGVGAFWFDASALYFRRRLTKTPIVISYCDILEVKIGKWHAGRWPAGAPVVKIVWKKADKRLSSGFVFSRHARETKVLVQEIRSRLHQTQ